MLASCVEEEAACCGPDSTAGCQTGERRHCKRTCPSPPSLSPPIPPSCSPRFRYWCFCAVCENLQVLKSASFLFPMQATVCGMRMRVKLKHVCLTPASFTAAKSVQVQASACVSQRCCLLASTISRMGRVVVLPNTCTTGAWTPIVPVRIHGQLVSTAYCLMSELCSVS